MILKSKTVRCKVEERCIPEYIAHYKCPYCSARGEIEIEEDDYTDNVQCWKCKTKFDIKIPKDSI